MSRPRVPFPRTLREKRSGEEVPVAVEATCPSCGLLLDDINALEGELRPGGWFQGGTRVLCECGYKYNVLVKIEDSSLQ